MILLLAALQLAVAVPIRLSAKDSANLVAHARDVEFRYLLDWRHEWQGWRAAVHGNQQVALDTVGRLPDPPFIKIPDGVCEIRPPVIMDKEDQQDCIRGAGRCGTVVAMQTFHYDVDQHACVAHLVRDSVRWVFSLIPFWVLPVDTEPADEARGIDNALAPEWRDTVRSRRVPLLRLLDSVARILPDDRWTAGQRVRAHLPKTKPISPCAPPCNVEPPRGGARCCGGMSIGRCTTYPQRPARLTAPAHERAGRCGIGVRSITRCRTGQPSSIRCTLR
jgi:hypothetical protein